MFLTLPEHPTLVENPLSSTELIYLKMGDSVLPAFKLHTKKYWEIFLKGFHLDEEVHQKYLETLTDLYLLKRNTFVIDKISGTIGVVNNEGEIFITTIPTELKNRENELLFKLKASLESEGLVQRDFFIPYSKIELTDELLNLSESNLSNATDKLITPEFLKNLVDYINSRKIPNDNVSIIEDEENSLSFDSILQDLNDKSVVEELILLDNQKDLPPHLELMNFFCTVIKEGSIRLSEKQIATILLYIERVTQYYYVLLKYTEHPRTIKDDFHLNKYTDIDPRSKNLKSFVDSVYPQIRGILAEYINRNKFSNKINLEPFHDLKVRIQLADIMGTRRGYFTSNDKEPELFRRRFAYERFVNSEDFVIKFYKKIDENLTVDDAISQLNNWIDLMDNQPYFFNMIVNEEKGSDVFGQRVVDLISKILNCEDHDYNEIKYNSIFTKILGKLLDHKISLFYNEIVPTEYTKPSYLDEPTNRLWNYLNHSRNRLFEIFANLLYNFAKKLADGALPEQETKELEEMLLLLKKFIETDSVPSVHVENILNWDSTIFRDIKNTDTSLNFLRSNTVLREKSLSGLATMIIIFQYKLKTLSALKTFSTLLVQDSSLLGEKETYWLSGNTFSCIDKYGQIFYKKFNTRKDVDLVADSLKIIGFKLAPIRISELIPNEEPIHNAA